MTKICVKEKGVKEMTTITMFHTEEDILKLTGLTTHDELWDAGFNLDDWDAGFCSDTKLHQENADEDSYYNSWTDDAYWLGSQMECYCVGYHYCQCNGKHYYTVYHA